MNRNQDGVARMLLRFSRGSYKYFIAAILAAAISILFNFLMPQIVALTIDSVIGDDPARLPALIMGAYNAAGGRDFLRDNLIFCGLAVVLSASVSHLFGYFSRINIAKGTENFIKRLRDTLFRHVQHLPFAWHTKNLTGDIIQRCTTDVETTRRFVSQQLIEVLRTAILVVTAIVIMFLMDGTMTLLVLAFIPIILLYTIFFYRRVGHKFLDCDETEGELMVRVQENLTGVRVVRAFGRERHEMERFNEKNDELASKWISLGHTLGIYWGMGDVVSYMQILSVIILGTFMAATGKITLGTLLVFISYTQTIAWPVRQLGRILSEMSKTGVALKRIKEILDEPAETREENAKTPPLDRDIEFRNVTFSFDGQPVLKDISFTIPHGTTFGILGATGSGKSTITYLLNRLYDLPEGGGSITIGGVDIREMDKSYLRRGVGLVLQEPFLFSRTIFENIDIAAHSRDMSRVRASADIAAIDEGIRAFVSGYDTVVGERGVTLSGGQKQRIAIARTLMLDAPIMIFDDSMSSLDMETDAKIRQALRENTRGATAVIISHRINTLQTADRIMVLEDGKILELGTHSELLALGGHYRRVYDLQSALGEEADTDEA